MDRGGRDVRREWEGGREYAGNIVHDGDGRPNVLVVPGKRRPNEGRTGRET